MTYAMTTPTRPDPKDWLTKRTLATLLRAELAAAERCRIAMASLDDTRLVVKLAGCRRAHRARAHLLTQELLRHGVRPPTDGGFRGALSTALQRLASALGASVGLAHLRRTERRQRRRYENALRKLKERPYRLVKQRLLGEQRITQYDVRLVATAVA